MSWKNIKLILLREIRDQMRDRRTIFMVAVLPIMLYPALGIGIFQMNFLLPNKEARTVVILGEEHLPEHPKLIENGQFVANHFRITSDALKLRVVTESTVAQTEEIRTANRILLEQARAMRRKVSELEQIENTRKNAESVKDSAHARSLDVRSKRINRELSRQFLSTQMQILIVIPDGFSHSVEEVNRQLAERTLNTTDDIGYPQPRTIYNQADEKSRSAYNTVREAMQSWERLILKQRLHMANLPPTLTIPLKPDQVDLDLAQDEQIAANLWSKVFPTLLVIMAVTGAFYPAVDLAAGEKERGTMETLLICPASRAELVMGKFFTVMLFSMSTALLNIVSIGLTARYMISIAGGGTLSGIGDVSLPSFSSLLWLVVLLIPLAALFSALCLALATFARSTKEGQYYLTPLLMVTMGLTVFCLSPAVEIEPFYSVMPVVGIALLLKALLLDPTQLDLYLYVIPVLVTSVGYSLLALWWAIEQFTREDVLFREAERFDVGLWINHLLRDKEDTPSFAEAGFCFVIVMLLNFATMKLMADSIHGLGDNPAPDLMAALMIKLLLIQQLAIIACPALLMGILLTKNVRRTFRLYMPSLGMLGLAAVLAAVLHPLAVELQWILAEFFPKVPEGILDSMTDPKLPLWFILLGFAVAPAICEEIAFRGFILSGFSQSKRVWLAIVLSSVTFGIMHMIPQQVFHASLLGLVLGLIATRSNSLLPCVVFHFVNNALAVFYGRLSNTLTRRVPEWLQETPVNWFLANDAGELHYQWITLTIGAVVAIVLLRKLVNQTTTESEKQSTGAPPPDRVSELKLAESPQVHVGSS